MERAVECCVAGIAGYGSARKFADLKTAPLGVEIAELELVEKSVRAARDSNEGRAAVVYGRDWRLRGAWSARWSAASLESRVMVSARKFADLKTAPLGVEIADGAGGQKERDGRARQAQRRSSGCQYVGTMELNAASLESRVMVSARKFADLKTAPLGVEIAELELVEKSVRAARD